MDAPGLLLGLSEECKIRLEEESSFCSVLESWKAFRKELKQNLKKNNEIITTPSVVTTVTSH